MQTEHGLSSERQLTLNNERLYIVVVTLLFFGALFVDSTWHTGAELHTLMELTATLLALIIGIISLIHYFTNKDNVFLFIGMGYFGTGLLDGYHAVVTSISFIDLHPSTLSELIAWSWSASRIYLSILMFLAYWIWARPQSKSIRLAINNTRLIGFLSLLLLSIFLFFIYVPLPPAYYQNSFFGRPGDLISGFIFLLALCGLYTKAGWREDVFEYWFVLSLLVNVICQFFYMPFSRQIFDGSFNAAHLLKIISYACVMIGLLISFYQLYRRDIKLENEIKQRQQAEQALNKNIELLKQQRIAAMNVAEDAERAKASLAKNKIFLDSVMNNMKEGVVACDANGVLSYFNQATIDFHGKDVSQLPVEEWGSHFDLYHADGTTLMKPDEIPLSRALTGEEISDVEMIIAPKNGNQRFIKAYGQAMFDELGNKLGAVVTMHDISESMAADAALKESEERFRAAFASAAHGMALVAPNGHWLKVNASLCDMLGYPEAEFLQADFQTLTHPDDLKKDATLVRQLLAGEINYYHLEKRYIHKQGHIVWILLSVSLVRNDTGEPQYFVAQIQDLSAQKAVEQEREVQQQLLIDKEAAESANKAKSQFLANMSHELRTPLNAIIGYSEMMAEDAEESGQSQVLDDLKKIHSSGKHLLGLVNDILDLSKVEAGKMDMLLEYFSVQELAYEVSATMQSIMKNNNNDFTTDYECGKVTMYSDMQKIKQILFNLLSNASKFTSDGEINLTIRSLDEDTPYASLEFIVSDNGIGMNEEQLERVFSAFTQADNNTTRKYGGTGLGLAITEQFCQILKGEIQVNSTLGKGTTFTVTLPCKLSTESNDISPAKKHFSEFGELSETLNTEVLTRLKNEFPQTLDSVLDEAHSIATSKSADLILVIDDDPNARELLSLHLSKLNFLVVTADNGMKGVNLARKIRPKMILLDLIMPHMNGWAVLQILKDDPQISDIPVILCSMIADQIQTGYTLGAADYLVKPVDRNRLQTVLQRYRSTNTCRVLIIEDDEITLELLVRTAQKQGWLVTTGKNGKDALKQLELKVPDLILLDLMMPEIDGFQLVDTLQQRPEWRDIPVIIMTAKDLTVEDHARLDDYVEVILEKGKYSLQELMQQITRRVETIVSVSTYEPEDVVLEK